MNERPGMGSGSGQPALFGAQDLGNPARRAPAKDIRKQYAKNRKWADYHDALTCLNCGCLVHRDFLIRHYLQCGSRNVLEETTTETRNNDAAPF